MQKRPSLGFPATAAGLRRPACTRLVDCVFPAAFVHNLRCCLGGDRIIQHPLAVDQIPKHTSSSAWSATFRHNASRPLRRTKSARDHFRQT
jgi:hypothetical protein